MKRLYDQVISEHLAHNDEMLFLSGPRQVGKTTVSQHIEKLTDNYIYLNWDDENHRDIILSGPQAIIEKAQLNILSETKPIIAFDEIHKRPDWKNFLKGFYDSYKNKVKIIVTGSARLDIYKRGGDSLMGRYFPYRMHPLSVAECIRTDLRDTEIAKPKTISSEDFDTLLHYGGFPRPFLDRNSRFSIRWQNLRKQQLLQEDIRDISHIHNINQLSILADMLKDQAASTISYSSLAKHIKVSVDTISRWLDILESFYYCYRIRPWSKNISRSLIKEPKIYLWDWSQIKDEGKRAENFVASHLLKAVHYWTDRGLGEYELYYLRTLEQQEVDFLVTKNNQPWFLVEVKKNSMKLNPNLEYFQKQSGAQHAFQVVIDKPFVNKDCFTADTPIIVPCKTFLSQLI
jgi:predicted AAA+ superfamily ATPase